MVLILSILNELKRARGLFNCLFFFFFSLSLSRTILGGHSDAAIDLSDPISDRFYKEVWMTTAGRNATIYEKVREVATTWNKKNKIK